jgi:hypothetical protein
VGKIASLGANELQVVKWAEVRDTVLALKEDSYVLKDNAAEVERMIVGVKPCDPLEPVKSADSEGFLDEMIFLLDEIRANIETARGSVNSIANGR